MRRTWGVFQAPESESGGGTGSGAGGGSPLSPSTPSSPGATTSGGADGLTSPAAPVAHDPIPWEAHEAVRTKAEKLSWAERYEDPQEVEEAISIQRWLNKDPVGYHDYITGLLKRGGYLKDPTPPAPRGPHTDPQTGRPLPDMIVQETGQKLYSAEQQDRLDAWRQEQTDKRIAPLEHSRAQQHAFQEAQAIIAEAAERLPYFNDFAVEIHQAISKDKRLSLEGAYTRVVVPKIRQIEREAMAKELKAKGSAGTHNPATSSPTATKETQKMSMKDLFTRELQRRGLAR